MFNLASIMVGCGIAIDLALALGAFKLARRFLGGKNGTA